MNNISGFLYHTSVQNMYRLSGVASIENEKIILSNRGSSAGGFHRHSVTGGFDICCKMKYSKKVSRC